MSLAVQRVLRERRRWLLPLAVVAVANLAVYALVVYPLGLRVAGLEERASSGGILVAQARAQLAAATALSERKARASADLERFYTEILPVDQTGARRITYLRLAQLARDSQLKYERRSIDMERDRESELTRMEMTMILDGSYTDVRRFIHRLETASEFIVIRNVELAQQSDPEAPLVLTLELATYYRTPHGS